MKDLTTIYDWLLDGHKTQSVGVGVIIDRDCWAHPMTIWRHKGMLTVTVWFVYVEFGG